MNTLMLLVAMLAVGDGALTYEEAYKETKNGEASPLYVYIGTDWCPGCKTLKARLEAQKVRYAHLDLDKVEDEKLVELYDKSPNKTIPQLYRYVRKPDGTFDMTRQVGDFSDKREVRKGRRIVVQVVPGLADEKFRAFLEGK